MDELAAEVSRHAGKTIVYKDLPKAEYKAVLLGAGLPEPVAELYADSDVGVANGQLDDSSGDLKRLIGRPTTTLAAVLAATLGK